MGSVSCGTHVVAVGYKVLALKSSTLSCNFELEILSVPEKNTIHSLKSIGMSPPASVNSLVHFTNTVLLRVGGANKGRHK